MNLSKHVPVKCTKEGGREFVSLEDYLACYSASEDAKDHIAASLASVRSTDVEKRLHDQLVLGLTKGYHSQFGDRQAPMVTRDGWVFWLYGRHESFLRSLAMLYSDGQSESDTYALKQGLIWYIASEGRWTIRRSRNYSETRDDTEIFKVFEVEYVD